MKGMGPGTICLILLLGLLPPTLASLPPTEGAYTVTGTGGLKIFTQPTPHKISPNEQPPTETRAKVSFCAAKHEFEPVQVVVAKNGLGAQAVKVPNFPNLGAGQKVEVFVGKYTQGLIHELVPIGATTPLSSTQNTVFWIRVYVPGTAPKGYHTTTMTIGSVSVPLQLYVFDFALPVETHFKTQMNMALTHFTGGSSDPTKIAAVKDMLYDQRWTLKGKSTWPSGFKYSITWDANANPNKCSKFYDEPNEQLAYSVKKQAEKYIKGQGWNRPGFNDNMLFQFVSNSQERPSTFCGQALGGSDIGTPAYNTEWKKYLTALHGYLTGNNYDMKRVYYYVQNEPQAQSDLDESAYLCKLTKAAAPSLRIAVSEEPKEEIVNNKKYGGCNYDIWIAHIATYVHGYAQAHLKKFPQQELWFYPLPQDVAPFPNPTKFNLQGMESRIWAWLSWSLHANGFAYYDSKIWWPNGNPSVSSEMFRDTFEDYEYLYKGNGNKRPTSGGTDPMDVTAESVAADAKTWTKDAVAFAQLRCMLGLYLEGGIPKPPELTVVSKVPCQAEIAINFQDPANPSAAVTINGQTAKKVGWTAYTPAAKIGWEGGNVGTSIVKYGMESGGGTPAQRSYIYDDNGRDNHFKMDIYNGDYEVTVAVGRLAKGYTDKQNVAVESTKICDNWVSQGQNPTQKEYKGTVTIKDGYLDIYTGGRDDKGAWAYTFVAYAYAKKVGGCTAAPVCGDKKIEKPTEECEGTDLGGATCASLGVGTGTLLCTSTCKFDSSGCKAAPKCGNAKIEKPTEDCEGTDLGGATCASLNLGTGTLKCAAATCKFDTSGCTKPPACGDKQVGAGEVCDTDRFGTLPLACSGQPGGLYASGNLACSADCKTISYAACVPKPPTPPPLGSVRCSGLTCATSCAAGHTAREGSGKPALPQITFDRNRKAWLPFRCIRDVDNCDVGGTLPCACYSTQGAFSPCAYNCGTKLGVQCKANTIVHQPLNGGAACPPPSTCVTCTVSPVPNCAPCNGITCQNGGSCTVLGTTATCLCPAGFTGQFCEVGATNPAPSTASPAAPVTTITTPLVTNTTAPSDEGNLGIIAPIAGAVAVGIVLGLIGLVLALALKGSSGGAGAGGPGFARARAISELDLDCGGEGEGGAPCLDPETLQLEGGSPLDESPTALAWDEDKTWGIE